MIYLVRVKLRVWIELICKIFIDDTLLSLKVKDKTFSDTQLNNDLNKKKKIGFPMEAVI